MSNNEMTGVADTELRPVFDSGIQIGMCGLCARLGKPFKKWSVHANCMMEIGYCPVLEDTVNTHCGGCWKFKAKTTPKKKSNGKKTPLTKQWNGMTYVLKGNRWVEQEDK